MFNVSLKDLQIFLAITTSGATLDQLVHVVPNYKDDFNSQHRDVLSSLFRLETAGLIYADKIHIDDWDASHVKVDLNEMGIDAVLADNWYLYHYHVSKEGRKCRKSMQTQLRDTLFGAPKETVTVYHKPKANAVNIVSRLVKEEMVPKSEATLPTFNPNPDSVPHQIIDTIKSWTQRIGANGNYDFESTDFSKAYDSYGHLFDELIGNSYNGQDLARAVYLMEDVVDMDDDIIAWSKAGIDLIDRMRGYTPVRSNGSSEWADHIQFMTIPDSTVENVSETLHFLCLRMQEIENGDYKQRKRWHGTETTDENLFTESELLIDELETLMINGYTLLAMLGNYVQTHEPRTGFTMLRTGPKFMDPQGFQKKEYSVIIRATKALMNLGDTFTLGDLQNEVRFEYTDHYHFILERFEQYGFIQLEATGPTIEETVYIKRNF